MKLQHAKKCIGAAALGLLIVACDKSGEDAQKKADKAQQELTQAEMDTSKKTDQAQAEANRKMEQAQSEADRKMAQANIELNKSVADYRATREKDLADVDRRLADLDMKLRTATGKKHADIASALPDLRTERDALARKIASLDNVTMSTFDATKADIDNSYSALDRDLKKVQ